jgi:solute carrier family 25 folate transporter 32
MVATYPHLVLRARLQDSRTPLNSTNAKVVTISSILKSIWQKEGFKGLYSGLKIDLVRVLPANSTTFIMFEYMKKKLEEALPREEQQAI